MRPLYAYCMFCETQRCKPIAEYISRVYGYTCFSPQIIQRKWIKGIPSEVAHQWLPGYLFLYSNDHIIPRFDIKGVIRCLGNSELAGQDLAFAEMIYQRKGIIGTIPLIQEGDKCSISDSAWADVAGKVIKIDRGRKRCCIQFEFDGIVRTLWAGYEFTDYKPE